MSERFHVQNDSWVNLHQVSSAHTMHTAICGAELQIYGPAETGLSPRQTWTEPSRKGNDLITRLNFHDRWF